MGCSESCNTAPTGLEKLKRFSHILAISNQIQSKIAKWKIYIESHNFQPAAGTKGQNANNFVRNQSRIFFLTFHREIDKNLSTN